MPTKTIHNLKDTFYFVTITCSKWLPLFELSNVFAYFPTWLHHLKRSGVIISGYVFMPNHLHLLLFLPDNGTNLNTLIGNSKRFLAYEIIKRLKRKGNVAILKKLKQGVRPEERRKGKKHQVFQPSFDAKEVNGEDEIVRVLDYIHHNPVSKKWMLEKDFVDYPYSSGYYYENNQQSYFPVVDYRAVWDEGSSESSKE